MRFFLRFAAPTVAVIFFAWIIPLGVFIAPSQEKIACGGRRAICQCSHLKAKAKAETAETTGIQNNSNINKEENTSGGNAANFFLAADSRIQDALPAVTFVKSAFFAHQKPFIESIEHVPIA